jgi:hypothetical protein
MTYKKLYKRRSLTLIEVIVAFSLVGLIVGECFMLLTRQIKISAQQKKLFCQFIDDQAFLAELKNILSRIYVLDKECIALKNGRLDIIFDSGAHLNPGQSGIHKRSLCVLGQDLVLSYDGRQTVMHKDILEFQVSFFSPSTRWASEWDSSKMGLPEMVKIVLVTKLGKLETKFLLPFHLKPVGQPCNSSRLSFV